MTSEEISDDVRPATTADLDRVVAALTTAFFHDPLWGPAFPQIERRAEQASAFWRLFANSALRYPWTLVTGRVESVAVWIPPGCEELTEAEQDSLENFLIELTGPAVAGAIMTLFEQFDAAHPSEPHYYLSLLATHSDHRGSGLGMAVLRQSLARIDALGVPTYLESSNPGNDARYGSVGFRPHGKIETATGHVITTMWRPVGG
jgi:GNAT superfamily N-acetyltransferase